MTKTITAERLEKLGFKAVSKHAKELSERKRKMLLAYEIYRYVRPEKVWDFNNKLRAKTQKNGEWQKLAFTPIEHYDKVPPEEVLAELEIAQSHKCFDSYEIAYIRSVKDPILFGRIDKCPDRFYIAQWDDDVKIEDILAPNEG